MEWLNDLLFLEGYWVVVFALVGVMLLSFLNRMRQGLMDGAFRKTMNTLFYIMVFVFYPVIIILLFARAFSGEYIPLLLSLFIICFIGRYIILSLYESSKGSNFRLNTRMKRTCKLAESYNINRMKKNPIANELIQAINSENPERVFICSDGVLRGNNLPSNLINPNSNVTNPVFYNCITGYLLSKDKDIYPGIVTSFKEYGYSDMDVNATRAMALLIAQNIRNYTLRDFAIRTTGEMTYDLNTGEGGGYIITGNTITGGPKESITDSAVVNLIHESIYRLTRNDIVDADVETPVTNGQRKERELKKW